MRRTIPKRRGLAAVALLAAVAAVAAACTTAPPGIDTEMLTGELKAREAAFQKAVADHDENAFREYWADDAVYLPEGAPLVQGRESIVEAWAPLLHDENASMAWTPDFAEVGTGGSLAYTYGVFRFTVTDDQGNPVERIGKYATVWRRGDDGEWRIVLNTGNSDALVEEPTAGGQD